MIGIAGPTMSDAMAVAGTFEKALLYSPAWHLARGIAERMLGLPQDPRADKKVPFRNNPTGARK